MFCCFRKLFGIRSLPACDPKIVSEYLHLFAKAKISPPFVKGAGGFNDRPKETPNISLFHKGQNISPFCKGGRGGFSQPASNGRNGRGDGEDLSGSGGEGGDVENWKSPLTRKSPPPPLFQRGGMFCCFRKLFGIRSLPACDPKIASEYLPLCQIPNTSPL
jgi:hypothetical protein